MQIVFLLSLRERFGGGDYSIFKFSEALAQRGHQVVVFYLGNQKVFGKEYIPTFKIYKKYNVELDFKGRGLLNIVIDKIYDQVYLNRYLKKNKNNIDFIIGYQREMALKAVDLGTRFGIKTAIFTFETPNWLMEQWPAWKTIYSRDAKLRKSWTEYRESLISSDLIIANSDITSDETRKWIGRTPDLVLYPGINAADSTLSYIEKQRQIIYIGRLEENKNINEIIEALALIQSTIKLVICGKGSMEKELIKLSKEKKVNVEFKGEVSEEGKWIAIKKSLFMVFPSSFEGFGMPPMEALVSKVPCLCSDIPILKKVYGDSVEYFEEHNIPGLGEKIEMLLSNTDYLIERGEYGYKYVIDNYGLNYSARKLEDCFNKLMKS